MTALAGIVVLLSLHVRVERRAGPPVLPDLYYLTEKMPVDQRTVPALPGARWGTIIGAPQGGPAPVTPPECGIFQSEGEATQKVLALRSANGAAIGVELALTPRPVDVAGLVEKCATFSMTTPALRSTTRLDAAQFGPIPPEAISVQMHTRTTTATQSLAWDIAMIVGTHRGILVTAEYTPGPHGDFDPALAAKLPALYRAQLARLDKF
ncbi:hypothetical protein [Mycolicibacterium chlorophenolicum]|uniref:DUF5642 domain-containing protein n=1 Tax=Mycolicibacterium chlorophenolicum TaxID=37916 RepID=A0A0J6VBE2_9MYCO|nr:hypothetical protein [Mycolicibacterium chlorophenolicum]KMO67494.1 hypothetical protein MCHLDSM_06743 [Mycolicibacterium chlorophenolicum]